MKTRENRGEKTRLSKIRTPPCGVRKFRTPLTLCEFAFAPLFKNCMLSIPCANSFFAPIFKTMLSVLENHRYAKISHTIFPCAKFIFLFKSFVLHFKILASSSILSKPLFRSPISIHKAPFLHHPSSSAPLWQPLSIAPLHSRGIHYSPLPIFGNFISFHHQNPFKSSPNPLNPSTIQSQTLFLPNQSLNHKHSSHGFFIRNPLPPAMGAPNLQFSS